MFENSSTKVYVVRHGETEWNATRLQQGHLDSPLTPNGIQQAKALAEGLGNKGITAVYSSDLGRAIQTAGIITKRLDLPVETDSRLRERQMGGFQNFLPIAGLL